MNAYARMTLAALGAALMLPWPLAAQQLSECSIGFSIANQYLTAVEYPDSENPERGYYWQAYDGSLRTIPLATSISITAHGEGYRAPMPRGDIHWWDFVDVVCKQTPGVELALTYVDDSQRVFGRRWVEARNQKPDRDIPEQLPAGDSIAALFRITLADGNPLPVGEYQLRLRVRPGAEEFFGAKCVEGTEVRRLVIKPREPGDDDAYLQEEIERHIRWGGLLSLPYYDLPEGKRRDGAWFGDSAEVHRQWPGRCGWVLQRLGAQTGGGTCASASASRAKAVGVPIQNAISSRELQCKCKACRFHFPVTEDGEYRGVATARSRFIEDIYTWRNNLYMKAYGHPVWTPAPTSAPAKAFRKP